MTLSSNRSQAITLILIFLLAISALSAVFQYSTIDLLRNQLEDSEKRTVLIKEELKLKKGSGMPNKEKVGTITRKQLEKIAEIKMADLNARDLDAAVKIIAGTARNMGVVAEGME